ncbi:endothelin-converting enzyme 1-like [Rhipicephalus microplus]|uniref:endothelin-converting enzyme 1-like n=1 Tax=Rhipicephalus microplus TaxID=6941 RepID=UPI003F6ACD97
MVRGSLDLGVEAVISLTFYGRAFVLGKRLMEMDYSKQQSMWRSENHGLNDYVLFLAEFGATSYSAYDLASKLRGYENQLDDISRATYTSEQTTEFVFELSKRTSPYVSKDDWDTFLYKYTNNTYTVDDNIFYRPYLATMIVKLFESTHVGKEGLQYLVAWTFYRQLFELTDPTWFLRGRSANDACYEHVKKVLKLAITSHHFQSVVPPRMLYQTKRMTSRIRSSFEEALQSSSWLTPEIRATSINKLINITVYTGSPGRRLDPDYVEELYKSFPDVPLDRLFPTWIRYLSLSTHLAWRDQKTILYDETMVNAFFSPIEDAVFITTAIMHRPFLYLYGPIGLNYGGLGTVIGHEIMHAFDVRSTNRDFWKVNNFTDEYTKRALCLRRSHRSVLSINQANELDDTTDSENLADLVGTMIAYAAYSSLPENHKSETLVGFNATSEQLFFINHCLKLCAQRSPNFRLYAPFRSRCIVPLMNMPEFSRVFSCAAGTPMNPQNKCKFW